MNPPVPSVLDAETAALEAALVWRRHLIRCLICGLAGPECDTGRAIYFDHLRAQRALTAAKTASRRA